MNDLKSAVLDALKTLETETGRDQEQLFGERVLEPDQMTPLAAHAAGIIEGAAIALGLTALELLDEVDAG
jgi:hypothetical protein